MPTYLVPLLGDTYASFTYVLTTSVLYLYLDMGKGLVPYIEVFANYSYIEFSSSILFVRVGLSCSATGKILFGFWFLLVGGSASSSLEHSSDSCSSSFDGLIY